MGTPERDKQGRFVKRPRAARPKRGRPSKYEPGRVNRILEALRDGNTRRAACAIGGICTETLADWLKDYSDFSEQVSRAEDEAEAIHAGVIQKAATGYDVTIVKEKLEPNARGKLVVVERTTETRREFDWKASQLWLSRRRHEEWGEKAKIEHTGADGEKLIPDEIIINWGDNRATAGAEGEA